MRRWILRGTAFVGFALLMAGACLGADEKSKKGEASEAKQKLSPAGQILGEVIKVEDGGKSFTLRIHQKTPQYRQATYGPFGRTVPHFTGSFGSYERMVDYMRSGGTRVSMKDSYFDIDMMLAEDAKIRTPFKPEYDDQTKKLKPESVRPDPNDPDRKLGGLKGSEQDLKNRDWVVVTLGTTRDKPPMVLATVVQVVSEPPEKAEKRKDK